ncbi:hypothetical protein FSOLCH5_004146 [Fusarium solani]|nr:hypothetical protein NW759_001332 [Fusarium solani]
MMAMSESLRKHKQHIASPHPLPSPSPSPYPLPPCKGLTGPGTAHAEVQATRLTPALLLSVTPESICFPAGELNPMRQIPLSLLKGQKKQCWVGAPPFTKLQGRRPYRYRRRLVP